MVLLRRIDKYIFKEILGPLVLGFLVYTFILLIQFLFRSAEMIIRRGVPASVVFELLMTTLPNIVVLTIPMSFLFAILVAIGRLSADSELIALRSSGVSLFYLFRPVLVLSLFLTGINIYLMTQVLPRGNHDLQRLRLTILTKSINQQMEPRVFFEDWEGLVLYVYEMPPDDRRWRGVFIADDLPSSENEITVAEWGQIRVDEDGERVVLELENALTHKVDFQNPEKYHVTFHRRLQRLVEDRFTTRQQQRVSISKGLRELTIPELRARLASGELPKQLHNLARVEIHKKYSIPAACIVFGIFALPLGFSGRKGSKSSSFAVSVGVILIYYILLNNGEEAARVGKMEPWLAMWLPNILLAGVGALLMARRNRDRGMLIGSLFHRVRRWIRGPGAKEQQDSLEEERIVADGHEIKTVVSASGQSVRRPTQVVVRVPRVRIAFPSIVDRYVARIFAMILGVVLFSTVAISLVANLTETVDDILTNEVPASVVLRYYRYLSLQTSYDLAPIIILVTTLVTFGLLSRTNEITAFKALGISLYRLSVPAVMGAIFVAGLAVYLQQEVLPRSNRKAAQIYDQIKGREQVRTYRRADRQWLFGQGRYIYNYLRYDESADQLQRLQIFEFDDDFSLRRRLFTENATHAANGWVFSEGWARTFDGLTVTRHNSFTEPRLVDYPEDPDYFESEFKEPDQMSYGELRNYISEIKESGQATPEMEVQLHNKVAFPFVSVVMALVALPFSFRIGKRGALYGLGVAVVLGMIFMAIVALFTTLGETGALPPLVAVWSPNLTFAVLAVYLFLGVES